MALTLSNLLFLGAIVCICQHELDAINEGEWRFFFQHISVSDKTAYRIFTALHVLMFVAFFWWYPLQLFQIFIDTFLIFHAGLHYALRNNPHVGFDNAFSWVWILGGAVFGGLHLLTILM
ncbi:MAG: DUF6713 family protein [Chloroflexota bacterium]